MLPVNDKTKGQLISDLVVLRQRVTELEALESERKRAEEALQESVEFSCSLLENAPNPISVVNPDTSIKYVNPAVEKLTGFSSAELVGRKPPRPWWPEEKQQQYRREFAEAIRKGTHRLERLFQRKNGERFWVEITFTPVIHNEELKYFLANWVDITERKWAGNELNVRARLLDGATDSIWVHDFDGNFVYVNEAAYRSRGYTRDELMGMNLRALIAPQYAELIESNIKRIIEKGESTFESAHLRKDGSVIQVEVHARTIKWGDGEFIFSVVRDITERRRAEEREKQLQEELYLSSRLASIGELAAGVAHEINNPLTGILGFSQRLLRKSTDEQVSRELEIIYSETLRAAKVVENLLTFARRYESKKEYSDINDFLQKTLELRAYELKTSNIEVELDLAPGLPKVMVDFYQIQEVFLNIILNAEQFMTEANRGGKLSIKTQKMQGYIRVSFTDDGPGIPAEHLDKLFNPFFTTRGERGGTGLGLSVCHGIVTEHGGRIYAKSKLGKGATFLVELPMVSQMADNSKV